MLNVKLYTILRTIFDCDVVVIADIASNCEGIAT